MTDLGTVTINGIDRSAYVIGYEVNRGRQNTFDSVLAGTAVVTVDNGEGIYTAATYPKLGQEIYIAAADGDVFIGEIDSVKTESIDGVPYLTINAVDRVASFGHLDLEEYTAEGQPEPLYEYSMEPAEDGYHAEGRGLFKDPVMKRIGTHGTYEDGVDTPTANTGTRFTPLLGPNWYDEGWYLEAIPKGTITQRIAPEGNWTVGFWVKSESGTEIAENVVFTIGDNIPIMSIIVNGYDNQLSVSFLIEITKDLSDVTSISNMYVSTNNIDGLGRGEWTHVVVTKTGATVRMYVNGTLRSTQTLWRDVLLFSPPQNRVHKIGSGWNEFMYSGLNFKGVVSSVFLDDVVWTDEQIKNRFFAQKSAKEAAEVVGQGETIDARLDRFGTYYNHPASPRLSAVSASGSVLDEIRRTAESVVGHFIDSKWADWYVQPNQLNPYIEGDLIALEKDINISLDDSNLMNSITVTKADGAFVQVQDDASIATYGERRGSVEVNLEDDTDVQQSAEAYLALRANPEVWIETSINLTAVEDAQSGYVGYWGPGAFDVFQVWNLAPLNMLVRVEGYTLSVNQDRATIKLYMSDASKFYNYVQLNSTTYGQLGNNKLGY